ncbi:MAG: hypothetical protein ACRERD_28440 [Candidatus Binatia bacterium]
MSGNFTESVVEHAALAWLESLGYTVTHGSDIVPESITFAALCNMLLPDLISGQLRVTDKDTERFIGRAV